MPISLSDYIKVWAEGSGSASVVLLEGTGGGVQVRLPRFREPILLHRLLHRPRPMARDIVCQPPTHVVLHNPCTLPTCRRCLHQTPSRTLV